MKIKLQEIFIAEAEQSVYRKKDLFKLKIKPDFSNVLAARLNLRYLENDSAESNLCFANKKEVRAEFRTTFNKMDIIHYVSSFITKVTVDLGKVEIPLPENAAAFWN